MFYHVTTNYNIMLMGLYICEWRLATLTAQLEYFMSLLHLGIHIHMPLTCGYGWNTYYNTKQIATSIE